MADAPLHNILYHLAGMAGAAEASDADLLARFADQHDQAAFAALLRRHGAMVLNVCRRLLPQTEDAEDVFQAVFLLLARKAASIRKRDAVASWLYGVAYRLASKARARRLRRQDHERRAGLHKCAETGGAYATPLAKVAWQQVQATLDEALWQLPEKYRVTLVLCYLQGMSHEEAACQLGCPLATLRSRLTRGREKLRIALTRRGLDLSAGGFAALLASSAVEGAVPTILRQTTLRAAVRFAAGEPANQIVSVAVAQLVKGGLRTMLLSKLKLGFFIVVAAGLLTTGAGFTAFQALATPQPSAQKDENGAAAAKEQPKAEKDKPKPSRQLVVRIVDNKDQPVADAEVYFCADGVKVSAEGRTDAEGRWSGRVPADAKHWGIFARKANVGFDYAIPTPRPGSSDEMQPLPPQIELKLDGARTLRVKTVDRHGKPIAGVGVGPWTIEKPGRGERGILRRDINLSGLYKRWPKTDKNGIVVFDWLPKRFVWGITILAHHDDYFASHNAASIKADKPVEELTITLLPMEKLSGRVAHADGRPAAEIGIAVQGQGGVDHNPFRRETKTDAEGRYTLKVCSEHAYIVAVKDQRWAAPYRAGIVVRADKPVSGVDFVLSRATRLHGRITVGKDGRPASGMYLYLEIDKGHIPSELQVPNDRTYHPVRMDFHTQSDKDGRYEFHLGPGEYQLKTQLRVEPVKITIPAANPPMEMVRDLCMPRPETGRFTGRVVDAEGRPIAGGVVDGFYAAQTGRIFLSVKTDEKGRFTVERSLDPLVLQAQTADKSRAGVIRIDAETAEAQIVVGPVAKASGRLLDLQGKLLAGKKLLYGIRVYLGDPKTSPWTDWFGGIVMTDAGGHFTITGLVPGEKYYIVLPIDDRYMNDVKRVKVSDAQALALGDLRVDPTPPRPYVPPTPAQRTADAFTANRQTAPQQRLRKILDEARREYTRPLLLFGSPKDPACVDLFRSFNQDSEQPSKLRWEFELASLDSSRTPVRELAMELGVPAGKDRPPILAVLNVEGTLAETYALRLNDKHKLDAAALAAFLRKHKLATRDAEKMLAEAREKAKAEDKRVFFIASASWCGPCRLLSRYLAAHKDELKRHYVFVKIDISRDQHADALCKRLQQGKHNGVPWYAILDADGKVRITSNAPTEDARSGSSNIGFPSSPEGIEHFLTMLKQTAPRLGQEQRNALRKGLERNE